MIVYKIDVIEALKEAGYNTGRIRKEHIISETTLQMLRENRMIAMKSLDNICKVLDMQPGNIIKYVDDEKITNADPDRDRMTAAPDRIHRPG